MSPRLSVAPLACWQSGDVAWQGVLDPGRPAFEPPRGCACSWHARVAAPARCTCGARVGRMCGTGRAWALPRRSARVQAPTDLAVVATSLLPPATGSRGLLRGIVPRRVPPDHRHGSPLLCLGPPPRALTCSCTARCTPHPRHFDKPCTSRAAQVRESTTPSQLTKPLAPRARALPHVLYPQVLVCAGAERCAAPAVQGHHQD